MPDERELKIVNARIRHLEAELRLELRRHDRVRDQLEAQIQAAYAKRRLLTLGLQA